MESVQYLKPKKCKGGYRFIAIKRMEDNGKPLEASVTTDYASGSTWTDSRKKAALKKLDKTAYRLIAPESAPVF